MNYITVLVGLIPFVLSASNITTKEDGNDIGSKTKRTVLNQESNYGENKAIILYDQLGSPAALATLRSTSPYIEPEGPKRVAAQQYIYEFQQTPTNAVSNVHLNQVYQPFQQQNKNSLNTIGQSSGSSAPLTIYNSQSNQPNQPNHLNQPNQNAGAESVVNPVQHNTFIKHNPNTLHPLPAQHIQSQVHIPGKYLYINGKIIYQPSSIQPLNYQNQQATNVNPLFQTQPQVFYSNPQTQLNPVRPIQFHYNQLHNPLLGSKIQQNNKPFLNDYPKVKLTPPPIPPITVTPSPTFNPPAHHQMQRITKPIINQQKNNEEFDHQEDDEEPTKDELKEDVEEESDDEPEHYESLQEDDDDDDIRGYFGRYREDDKDDDQDDHYQPYKEQEEEEEDDDSERGSSRYYPRKTIKKTHKRIKERDNKPSAFENNYKFSESYKSKSKSKYLKPIKKTKGHKKQNKNRKDNDRIIGRYSEHVPVTHNKKIFTKKWVVTKSEPSS